MTLKEMAYAAYRDLLENWWTGDEKTGHFIHTDGGIPREEPGFLWEHAMAIFGMDSLYQITGDKEIRDRIIAEWNHMRACYPDRKIYVEAGKEINWAQDDAGWNAMLYMLAYRYTGDPFCLGIAKDLIRDTYDYWADGGDLKNGLLYDHQRWDPTMRNVMTHAASTTLAAFDYWKATGDDSLMADAVTVYEWVEENMLRKGEYWYILHDGTRHTGYCDDLLYWFSYNKERETFNVYTGPEEGPNPNKILEADSAIFLGGTMGMGVLHVRMYQYTGDETYLRRAVETLHAVTDNSYLVQNGVLVDAGDGWTNAAFMQQWVSEVLTLEGARCKDVELLKNTAESIYRNARTPKGLYSAAWSGPAENDADTPWGRRGWTHDKLMTCATCVHMIIGAYCAECKGPAAE